MDSLYDDTFDRAMMLDSPLMHHVQQTKRLQQEERSLSLRTSITGALNKMPVHWIAGIAQALAIRERLKKQRIKEIARALNDPFSLAHIVERLPTFVRRLIKTVLDNGAWERYDDLVRTFGSDIDDGWYWDTDPPESPLGIARLHGIVMVGTAEIDDHLEKVVVIPVELREALEKILALEESLDLNAETSTTNLAQILADVDDYYAESKQRPFLSLEDSQAFLSQIAKHDPAHLNDAWNELQLIFLYLDLIAMGDKLDQLDGYHLSEFMHEFLDELLPEYIDIPHRRHLLETFQALIGFLASQGRITPRTCERLKQATKRLLKPRRSLSIIERPQPLGGEPLFLLKTGRQRVVYTYNDLWLLLAAEAAYAGDLQALHVSATGVPDATTKRKRIEWLMKHDLDPLYEYALYVNSGDYMEACAWFEHGSFNHSNAWLPSPD